MIGHGVEVGKEQAVPKRRVNCVAKGNRRQNACRKKLESEGWKCYVARRGYKGQEIDIFGLWDVIAWREGYFKLVQVKSNYCKPDVRRELKAFLCDGYFVHKELWIYIDNDRKNPYVEELYGPDEKNSDSISEASILSDG